MPTPSRCTSARWRSEKRRSVPIIPMSQKGNPFEITLSEDGSAKGSRSGEGLSGTWKAEGDAAVITWESGWTTKITKQGDQFKKPRSTRARLRAQRRTRKKWNSSQAANAWRGLYGERPSHL